MRKLNAGVSVTAVGHAGSSVGDRTARLRATAGTAAAAGREQIVARSSKPRQSAGESGKRPASPGPPAVKPGRGRGRSVGIAVASGRAG